MYVCVYVCMDVCMYDNEDDITLFKLGIAASTYTSMQA